MATLKSFVSEVEDAVSSGDPVRRVDTLRRMTDLFIDQAPALKEVHVAVFDEVILRLSRDIEFKARVELSDRLADVANAPRQTVRELAFDENIKVAGPVLERSTRLEEEDLVSVARARGQDHLFALSRRPTLSERVTDVLVDRGDQRVVRSVAGNSGARFSETGFTQLVGKARADAALQGILTNRRDVPPTQMAQLVAIAREKARETMREEFGDIDESILDTAIDDVAEKVSGSRPTALTDDLSAAVAVVANRGGTLGEDDVVAWVRDDKIEEAIAAMAQLAGVPVGMVSRAYHAGHYDPLLFIVRSLKFGWGTFKLLLTAKAGRAPPHDVLKSAFDAFQKLSVPTAQRVVRFTAVREKAMQPDAA